MRPGSIDSRTLPSRATAYCRAARRLGIGRFEANLVVAVVQHERRNATPVASTMVAQPRGPLPGLAAVALVLALEVLIAFAAWLVFHA